MSDTRSRNTGPRRWIADLSMGARFAVTGGREGWARTLLTAVGVGLGVALLLIAAAVPNMLQSRQSRDEARATVSSGELARAADTLVVGSANTTYHNDDVYGRVLRADGPKAPTPPGVSELLRPGEMVVSPALAKLLASSGGKLLKERLAYKIVGTIGDEGLLGPSELAYYAGSDTITTENGGVRIDKFGNPYGISLDALLTLLVVIACVVLLLPVAVFIGTAVRFGGERRDRRLAALRLVGADARMARRIASGEALTGSLLGLLAGGAFFLIGRQRIGSVALWDVSVFPSDVRPGAALTALIVLGVPASAVGVTLLALRGVTIEPLGVVRHSGVRRRRLWWRLLVAAAGLALLLPFLGGIDDNSDGDVATYQVAAGTVLLLVGVTTVLPWLVEAVVTRCGGGPVPWQLAIRRLQLSSGSAARTVSGVTIAVAGAIAVQMLFAGSASSYRIDINQDPDRAQMYADLTVDGHEQTRSAVARFRDTAGVTDAMGVTELVATKPGKSGGSAYVPTISISVADCDSLRELAHIGSCKNGSVFIAKPSNGFYDSYIPARGEEITLGQDGNGEPAGRGRVWTVPATAKTVQAITDPMGRSPAGVLATPGALDTSHIGSVQAEILLRLDSGVSDAEELVRNTAARISPVMHVGTLRDTGYSKRYANIKLALFIGATAVLLLIGASLVVATLEQLRERRRLLSVLVAFGTRRATLGWSVLWQTAVPVTLGLALAVAGGLGLGAVLLAMAGAPLAVDWTALAAMVGIGAGMILLVTLLSMGPLWRMMRPDGLRTE